MDLIGFVIAGQRVHHEIDAAAQRHFALARAAGNQRIERLPLVVGRPGGGEIIGGDDDRRNAVAGARRARRAVVGIGRRQRLDPGLADFGAADEAIEQIEGLGHDMIARHRLELGHVDAGEQFAQP